MDMQRVIKVNGVICTLNRFYHKTRSMSITTPIHGPGTIYLNRWDTKGGVFCYRHWKTGKFCSEPVQLG